MKRIILLAAFAVCAVITTPAQVTGVFKTLDVKTSIKLGSHTITSFSDDTTGTNQSSAKLLTERAAKLLIVSRFNSFSQIPSQTGNSGKYLTTNGSTLSWATVAGGSSSWSAITGTPTTLSGYGITDAASITHTHPYDQLTGVAATVHTHSFSSLTSLPTTLAGYGITDNVTIQGNTFNSSNKLLQLNSAGAIPALDGGLLTGLNASNLSLGTVADGRLSSNVSLLNAVQTVSADKIYTGLVTHTANGIGANTDYTKGVAFENTTTATVSNPVEAAPLIRISGKVYSSLSGTGIVQGSNAAEWVLQHVPVTGTNITLDNQLQLKQRIGTNSYATVATFTKDGLVANLQQNTLSLGSIGSGGVLSLKRGSDGAIVGAITGSTSGMSISTGYSILTLGTGNYMSLGSGDANYGSRYSLTGGLYLTANTNAAATPNSRLVVIGGGYFGTTNGTAPSGGIQCEGEAIFGGGITTPVSSKSSNYTLTSNDECIKITTAGTTYTLPTAVGRTGKQYTLVNASSGDITIATTSSQLIGNYTTSTTLYAASNSSYILKSDGAGWMIVAKF